MPKQIKTYRGVRALFEDDNLADRIARDGYTLASATTAVQQMHERRAEMESSFVGVVTRRPDVLKAERKYTHASDQYAKAMKAGSKTDVSAHTGMDHKLHIVIDGLSRFSWPLERVG